MPRLLAFTIAFTLALTSVISGYSSQADDPVLLVGLGAIKLDGGHFLVTLADGTQLTTHGPDPMRNHGGSIRPGDPERPPFCATDYYQHVLYGRLQGSTDRYSSVKGTIQASVRRMNAVLNEDSLQSGDWTADYKVKCDPAGNVQVDSFTASGTDFTSVVNGARDAGFNLTNVDYTIFFDDQPENYCGIGSYTADERLTANNVNNSGGDYGISYNLCWTNETPMHENGHNQGAVQYGAPYSTGSGGHCYDENDVMCYSPDGGDINQGGTINRCTDRIYFDCGDDSYFDSSPELGEYLYNHWNIGSSLNRFVVFGSALGRPPKAAIGIQCSNLACSFTDNSTDDGAIVAWSWSFGDGATSNLQNPTHSYAGAGTYLVSLTVTDDKDMSSSASQTLTVPNNGDPDPATPNMGNNTWHSGKSGNIGDWSYYKIYVPQGRPSIQIFLQADACVVIVCHPDLDIYLRPGQRPTLDEYTCRSIQFSNEESCITYFPPGGYWYVGVYTAFASPNVVVDLTSIYYQVLASYS